MSFTSSSYIDWSPVQVRVILGKPTVQQWQDCTYVWMPVIIIHHMIDDGDLIQSKMLLLAFMSPFTAAEWQKASLISFGPEHETWISQRKRAASPHGGVNHINYRITEQRPQKCKNRKSVGLFALTVHPAACLVLYWWKNWGKETQKPHCRSRFQKTLPLLQRSSKNTGDGSGKWLPERYLCPLFWQINLTIRQMADVAQLELPNRCFDLHLNVSLHIN